MKARNDQHRKLLILYNTRIWNWIHQKKKKIESINITYLKSFRRLLIKQNKRLTMSTIVESKVILKIHIRYPATIHREKHEERKISKYASKRVWCIIQILVLVFVSSTTRILLRI